MLNDLSADSRKQIVAASVSRKLGKGEMLFLEGKIPSHVFFLVDGKMKLYTTDLQGREQIIHLAGPGDLMGYRAILGGDSLSCSAAALELSHVLVVPKDVFLRTLETDASFSHQVIQLLTNELRHAEHHLAGLARKSVRARLAEVLLIIGTKFGYEKDEETLAVTLSREEIAGLVGTATETVIRLLHAMKDEGLLATNARKIRLINKDGLRKCAEDL